MEFKRDYYLQKLPDLAYCDIPSVDEIEDSIKYPTIYQHLVVKIEIFRI